MNARARAIFPDAVTSTDFILIKSCPKLRPTYEIRLAAYLAQQTGRKLRLILTGGGSQHASLTSYASQHGISIEYHQ